MDSFIEFAQQFGALDSMYGEGQAYEHVVDYLGKAAEHGMAKKAIYACYLLYKNPKKIIRDMLTANNSIDKLRAVLPFHNDGSAPNDWQVVQSNGATDDDPTKKADQEKSRNSKYTFLQGVNISLAQRVAMIYIDCCQSQVHPLQKYGFGWKTSHGFSPGSATLDKIIKSPMVIRTAGKPGGLIRDVSEASKNSPSAYGEHVRIMFEQFTRYQNAVPYRGPAMDTVKALIA